MADVLVVLYVDDLTFLAKSLVSTFEGQSAVDGARCKVQDVHGAFHHGT
jgi:hypothetical protein